MYVHMIDDTSHETRLIPSGSGDDGTSTQYTSHKQISEVHTLGDSAALKRRTVQERIVPMLVERR